VNIHGKEEGRKEGSSEEGRMHLLLINSDFFLLFNIKFYFFIIIMFPSDFVLLEEQSGHLAAL
jgi:hypothetical protein